MSKTKEFYHEEICKGLHSFDSFEDDSYQFQQYQDEQEYRKYQELMNTKEILTQEEYEFCKSWDPEEAKEKLFHNFWNNTYLNLNLYSEVEHHERQFQMELGF
jgi:hypothetical protein